MLKIMTSKCEERFVWQLAISCWAARTCGAVKKLNRRIRLEDFCVGKFLLFCCSTSIRWLLLFDLCWRKLSLGTDEETSIKDGGWVSSDEFSRKSVESYQKCGRFSGIWRYQTPRHQESQVISPFSIIDLARELNNTGAQWQSNSWTSQ